MKKIFPAIFLLLAWTANLRADEITVYYQKLEGKFFAEADPKAEVWAALQDVSVPLFPQNIATPFLQKASVGEVKVKAIHDGTWFSMRLEWKDLSKDINVETDRASDACAIQFPLTTTEQTSPFMGAKGNPVAIIHWKAIWQEDVDRGYQQVKDLYPNTWVDTYQFGTSVAIDAKNPVANLKRTIPAEELIAEGFGTLTTQKRQDAKAKGVWNDGVWSVVFVRKLKTKDKHDPIFTARKKTGVAFAVWQGKEGNIGARKNYAPWTTLQFEEKR